MSAASAALLTRWCTLTLSTLPCGRAQQLKCIQGTLNGLVFGRLKSCRIYSMLAKPALFTFLAGMLFAIAGAGKTFQVQSGTHIPLSLSNSISTERTAVGDPVRLETMFPILSDGRIVIPPGSSVMGTVTKVVRPDGVDGHTEATIRFDSLILPNRVTRDFRGREATPSMSGVLSTSGPNAALPQGTKMEMVLDQTLAFDEAELDFSNIPVGDLASRPNGDKDTSGATAHTPQGIGGASSALRAGTGSPQPAGKGFIYVYRSANTLGWAGHPLIFVNRNFLTVLHRSTYAVREVPQGMALVAATGSEIASAIHIPPHLGTGCAGVDWRSLGAHTQDVAGCLNELWVAAGALTARDTRPNFGERDAPGTAIIRMKMDEAATKRYLEKHPDLKERVVGICGPYPLKIGRCLAEIQDAMSVLSPTIAHRVEIPVEAGKSYYVKWAVGGMGDNKLTLEDPATGAKEVRKFHLAKD